MTQKEMVEKLKRLGCKSYQTTQVTYTEALVGFNDCSTLYLLVRTNGVDIRCCDHIEKIKLAEKGLLSINHQLGVNNHYKDCKIDLNQYIITVSQTFFANKSIEYAFKNPQGTSAMIVQNDNDMIDMYNELCVVRGEDVYLADGMYIRPDGSTYNE